MLASFIEQGNKEHAQLLRRIKRGEETKRLFRKLAVARGKTHEGGLSHISVPADPECTDYKNCQEWKDVDDPEEMDRLLAERNRDHFGQSGDANLCMPPVDILMDFEGSCAKADAILF